MRSDDGRVVSNMICQALAADDITVYGDGSQTRSFCYVEDLIDGFMRLMTFDGGLPGAVNLGNPVELSVADLANRILAMTGSSSRIVTRPLPVDDPRQRRPEIKRAQELLGWMPHTPLDIGLSATISWFSSVQARKGRSSHTFALGRSIPA
jgi:UDP-glucuronate decarboxylase